MVLQVRNAELLALIAKGAIDFSFGHHLHKPSYAVDSRCRPGNDDENRKNFLEGCIQRLNFSIPHPKDRNHNHVDGF